MKKYISIIIAIICLNSCSDELNLAPISEASVDNFYQTAEDMEQAVVAAYDALQARGLYGNNFMFYMEIRSDNATVESPTNSGGVYGEFDLFSITPGNEVIDISWNDCYQGIQRCNIILNRIPDVEMVGNQKTILTGEAKFIRALIYFNMVQIWGDVPLVLTETQDPFEAFEVGRTPVQTVYEQIIKDLTEAVNDLPPSQSQIGRATKGAAQTLLGKVHLTLKDYSSAITLLKAVNGYKLTPDYHTLFGPENENNSDESILEIQFKGGKGSIYDGGEGSPFPNLVAPVGTASSLLNGIGPEKGENIPTNELFASFEDGDIRKDIAIGNTGTVKYSKKLITPPVSSWDSDLNIIVLRYADVLLMLAEALNEQGYVANGEAFEYLNEVRERAGLLALTNAELTNQEEFRDAVAKERRHEFVSENQRWFDLVRTGVAIEVMNASTSVFTVHEHQLLFPLPISAIDAMNNPEIFPQNPGY